MAYGNNMFRPAQPSNSLWVGNNYSTNYPAALNNTSYPMMQNQMQPMNNILQVMGLESAQAYQIGPDSQVLLMDSNRPVFYLKKSDSSGYAEVRAFEFHEIPLTQPIPPAQQPQTQQQPVEPIQTQDFVTKKDFEEFKKMIEDLVMKNE